MEAITNRVERQNGRRVTIRKTMIGLLLGSFVVLGVAASKETLWPVGEKSVAKDSLLQPASCRLVLASLPGDKPIDREIAQQQALVARSSSSTPSLERLG